MKPARPAGDWTEQELIPADERHAKAHGPGHVRLPIAAQLAQGVVKICREGVKQSVVRFTPRNRDDVEWREAIMPSRSRPQVLGRPSNVTNRAATRRLLACTAVNSPR
jgi:hypothetical protein